MTTTTSAATSAERGRVQSFTGRSSSPTPRTPTTALLTAAAMQPGDVFNAQLNLTNANTVVIQSHLSMTHAAPTLLAAELVLAITDGGCGANAIAADGTAVGPNVFFGPYNTAGELTVKAIPALSLTNLCWHVGLPSGVVFSPIAGTSDDATVVIDSDNTP